MEAIRSLSEDLKNIIDFLSRNNIRHALAGGLAFSALVEPRATIDIDLLISADVKDIPKITESLKKQYPDMLPHTEPMTFGFTKIWRVVNLAGRSEIIIDFILAEAEFHQTVLNRAAPLSFLGTAVNTVSIEDLILMKAVSKRLQDLADIEKIARFFAEDIDREYILSWMPKLNIQPGVLDYIL